MELHTNVDFGHSSPIAVAAEKQGDANAVESVSSWLRGHGFDEELIHIFEREEINSWEVMQALELEHLKQLNIKAGTGIKILMAKGDFPGPKTSLKEDSSSVTMSLKDLKAIIGEIYGSKKPSTVAASTAVGAVEKPQRTADGSKSSRGVKANAHTSGPARNDPPRVIVAHKGEMQAVRVTAVASKSKELPSGSNRHGENGGTAARKKPASVSNSEHTLSSQVKAEPAQRVFVKVAKDAEKPRKAASTLSVSERRNIASKSTESVVSASTTGRSKLVARSSSVVGSKKPEHPAQPGQPGHFADHRHDHKAGSHLTLHHAPGKSPNEKPPSTMHLFNSTLSPVRADALDGRPTSIPTPHGTMKKRLPSQHSSVSIQQPALSAQPGVDRPAQEQRTSKPSSRAKSASIATSDSARATYAESLPKTADTGRSRSRSAAASIDADVDID